MMDYLKQSPIIPLVISAIVVIVILMQSVTKKKFQFVKLMISFLLTFGAALILFFYAEIQGFTDEVYKILIYIAMMVIDLGALLLLFLSIDLSLTNETFQKELVKSLDETKLYVLLDKKDRIKDISKYLTDDLGIEESSALRHNFFDVIEAKYRIIGINGEGALKKDVKKYYSNYAQRATEEKTTMELEIEDDYAVKSAMYFQEHAIFRGGKYAGRILIGDIKGSESLIGLERKEAEARAELELIKNRFTTVINNSEDGIFFNTLNNDTIWCNDVLVKKLFLTSNVMSSNDFFKLIHPDDLRIYQEKIAHLNDEDYSVSYRFYIGSQYVYVKEEGHKIISNKTIELCGILHVLDDYGYEKTQTKLDNVKTEADLLNKLQKFNQEDRTYMLVEMRVNSIPDINEKFGRAVGNMCLAEYVNRINEEFVTDDLIYRVGGLNFVAVITQYNNMEKLKSNLRNDERILHASLTYGKEKVAIDVNMGISMSSEAGSPKDIIKNAHEALKYSLNPKFQSSFLFYKDMRS